MKFSELSNRVIGCAIEVHRNLGPGKSARKANFSSQTIFDRVTDSAESLEIRGIKAEKIEVLGRLDNQ